MGLFDGSYGLIRFLGFDLELERSKQRALTRDLAIKQVYQLEFYKKFLCLDELICLCAKSAGPVAYLRQLVG